MTDREDEADMNSVGVQGCVLSNDVATVNNFMALRNPQFAPEKKD